MIDAEYLAQFQSKGGPPPDGGYGPVCPECDESMWVELGGGNALAAYHPNCDFQDVPGVDVVIDFEEQGLPFHDEHAERVKAIHLLEHISGKAGDRIMREAFRILRPGGSFYIMVPDLEFLCQRILEDGPTHEYHWIASLYHSDEPSPAGFHRWAYRWESLKKQLEGIGFSRVEHRGWMNAWDLKLEAFK